MSRRRVTEREASGVAKRKRHQAKTGRVAHFPNRGQKDAYGEVFGGFDSLKLAEKILTDPDLYHERDRPDYIPGEVAVGGKIKTFPGAVVLHRDNVRGEVVAPGNIIGTIPKAKVAGDGSFTKGEISTNGRWIKDDLPTDTVFTGADGKLAPGIISNPPWLTSVPDAYLTKAEADKLYRKI